ncbi:MAG TPA: metallophosphoesterase [Longimicrobium sp.]|nr:metallophosphoesterase [Longimicrobium sp.]
MSESQNDPKPVYDGEQPPELAASTDAPSGDAEQPTELTPSSDTSVDDVAHPTEPVPSTDATADDAGHPPEVSSSTDSSTDDEGRQPEPVAPTDISRTDAPTDSELPAAAEPASERSERSPAEVAEESGEIDLGQPPLTGDEAPAAAEETSVPVDENAGDPPVLDTPPADATSPDAQGSGEEVVPDTAAQTYAEAPPRSTANDPREPEPSATDAAPAPVATAVPSADPRVSVLEVRSLDWDAVRAAVTREVSVASAELILSGMEARLAEGGPLGLAFEDYLAGPDDRVIQIGADADLDEVWFVGDVHGDLLALEAALQHIDRSGGGAGARIVFLGDLFDDGMHSPEVVLRIFDLVLNGPMKVTIIAGNHDEALAFDGERFQSTVLPSDFTDWLNTKLDRPWAVRLGKVIIEFFARAPRALYFPDGLLVAHGGIPHTDLHAALEETGNWNDPRMITDYVWLRAHPRARKRIPNRTTRGSEFGRDDLAAFAEVATRLGRPVTRLLRGHDHLEDRFELFPAYVEVPVLTINTLSHRLPREVFGTYERVPVIARFVDGEVPEVRRLFIPPELVREIYPEPGGEPAAETST